MKLSLIKKTQNVSTFDESMIKKKLQLRIQ